MPWFQVDDQLGFHPKAIAAGNAAMGLWVRAGSWSMQQLTGGFVPAGIVRGLGTVAQAKKLVEVRLWIEVDGGYQFHDWADRQMSKEEIEERRRRRSEAGRKGGQRSGESRRSGSKVDSKTGTKREASASPNASAVGSANALANAEAEANQTPKQTRTPVPVPVPDRGYVGGESLVATAREHDPPPPPRRCADHPDGPMRDCGPCLQAMDDRRWWTAERVVVDVRPPNRCPEHVGFEITPYCVGCRDARLAGERWDTEHAQRIATAKNRANQHAAADRAKTIAACPLECGKGDDPGYLDGSLCDHDPESADRRARGMAKVRASLAATRSPQPDPPTAPTEDPDVA